MMRVISMLVLLAVAVPLSGCVVGPGGGGRGWCYWHPYRCGR